MESAPFLSNFGMTTVWLLAFAAFMLAEVMTAGTLVSIWFCAGSLVAVIAAAMGAGKSTQLLIFALSSALMMLLLRPAATRYLNKGFQPTNADRIIGQLVFVTEEIDKLAGTGAVRADGKIWTAININGDERIYIGEEVTIEEIKGVRVFVKKV